MRRDPTFVLSDGGLLEILADHPVDPWSFTVPGMTYIGSPSDPRYTKRRLPESTACPPSCRRALLVGTVNGALQSPAGVCTHP
jgi:hypothetical protein